MRLCSECSEERPVIARGLCSKHYMRQWRAELPPAGRWEVKTTYPFRPMAPVREGGPLHVVSLITPHGGGKRFAVSLCQDIPLAPPRAEGYEGEPCIRCTGIIRRHGLI